MRVLLVGGGAREHALAWKFAASKHLQKLFLWPGSPVLNSYGQVLPAHLDYQALAVAAKNENIDFAVVGPEKPLAEGIADTLKENGIKVFGPSQRAAAIESSKAFAKELMSAAGIPTARFCLATSESECKRQAMAMLAKEGGVVLKASGLAQGKGVFVCTRGSEVEAGLQHLFGEMKGASETVVVEELMTGRECSYFTFCGEEQEFPFGFAVDFKRLQDGDRGPNTGGMGSYTPVPWLPQNAAAEVTDKVVDPLRKELLRRGIPYVGWLYVGLMWTATGPRVVEFNCRLGDPEAQSLAVSDPRDWLVITAKLLGFQGLPEVSKTCNFAPTLAVVMAGAAYPFGSDPDGKKSAELDVKMFSQPHHPGECEIFGASLSRVSDKIVRTGDGRVLTVVAKGEDFAAARQRVYRKVEDIAAVWPQAQWRRDIGGHLFK